MVWAWVNQILSAVTLPPARTITFTQFLTTVASVVDERYSNDYGEVQGFLLHTRALLYDRARIQSNHSLAVFLSLMSVWSYAYNADRFYSGSDAAIKYLCFKALFDACNLPILIINQVHLKKEWVAPVLEPQMFAYNETISHEFLSQRRALFLTSLFGMNHVIQQANNNSSGMLPTLLAAFACMVVTPVLNDISVSHGFLIFALSIWLASLVINQARCCGEQAAYCLGEVTASLQRSV